MNFQSSLNNLLNTAAIMGRLSPAAELGQVRKQEKQLEKQGKVFENMERDLTLDEAQELSRLFSEEEAVKQKKFELKPTAKTYEEKRSASVVSRMTKASVDAMSRLQEEQQRVQKSRRDFTKDYLSKQSTSLGGTVGELPPDLQKKIAEQYSKSQRKSMMDRMDKEEKINSYGK